MGNGDSAALARRPIAPRRVWLCRHAFPAATARENERDDCSGAGDRCHVARSRDRCRALPQSRNRPDRDRRTASEILFRRTLRLARSPHTGCARLARCIHRSLDHRRRRGSRRERRHVEPWRHVAVIPSGQSASLRVSFRPRNYRAALLHHLPLMLLLFLVLCPIAGALIVLAGAPARITAMCAAMLELVGAIALFALFETNTTGFQHVISFPISADWGLNFTLGVDG